MEGKWRVLDTGTRTAAENMCLDKAVLLARAKGKVPDTIRFLGFSPPAVLIGFHQSVEQEVRETFCRENGVDINRRITGGGAIFFDESQLGWEVISGLEEGPRDIQGLYKRLCSAAIKGLQALGVDASFRPVNDIEVKGRKISGTGGTELEGAYLFQGTLLVDFDIEIMLRSLRIPTEKLKDKEIESARERVTCIKRELGRVPELSVLKGAIIDGFKEVFGGEFIEGGLTDWEQGFLDENLGYYGSEDWIYKVRRPLKDARQLYSVYKAPGGIIRTSLRLDDKFQTIKYIMITGDFFAYPNKTVLDLEAALKNCKVKRMAGTIKRFFEDRQPELPGMTSDDFVNAVESALKKRDLLALGLSAQEANMINTVHDALDHLDETTVVLLPYCAKWQDCKLRYDEDCLSCGKCTVGVAYELARMRGMEPITIVNFEHLWEVLSEMKRRGVRSYIGCCCEPFYIKHREDFEASGVAGILIDVDSTSCYELDQEKEGKLGVFKEETKLDVELLKKVIGVNGLASKKAADTDLSEMAEKEEIKAFKKERRCLYAREKGLEE